MHNMKRVSSALIVEDDEATAYMLDYMLQREGYTVSHATDGRAAVEYISQAGHRRISFSWTSCCLTWMASRYLN